MKILSKSLFIILLTMIIGAACQCDSNVSNYKVTGFILQELEGFYDSKTREVTFDSQFTLKSSDTVRTLILGYHFSPEVLSIAAARSTGLFNSAFADCSEGTPSPTQKFSSITITSSNPYITASKTYAPGESLNSVFTSQEQSGGPVEDGLLNNYVFNTDFIFMIRIPPTGRQPHQFTFTISLDDGSDLEIKSETLMLEP